VVINREKERITTEARRARRYNERVQSLLLSLSEKRKQFELRALGLRDFAGVTEDQPLDPFALANFARLLVVDFESIEGLSVESRSHLLGAAGAIESVICVLAVKNSLVPATINTQHIDEQAPAGLPILLGSAKKMEVNYALNNTFGFGGHTASTLFKKYSND